MGIKINSTHQRGEEPESSVLYVVGTPIGNLKDISQRSINLLSKVSFIACEDTRHTRRLLNALNIKNNLLSFNEHNSKLKTIHIIKKLKEGYSIALVSDAGMPLISDPGEYLIKKVRENKIEVICSPGPTAALTGLVSSGLPSKHFLFIGFISRKVLERKKYLNIISNCIYTTIIFESPKRIKQFLKELIKFCGEDRQIHIAKELTKIHEKHWNGKLSKIIKDFEAIDPKGEYTIFIKGKDKNEENLEVDEQSLKNDLNELIKLGLKRSSAASFLANKNGISKNLIYNLI